MMPLYQGGEAVFESEGATYAGGSSPVYNAPVYSAPQATPLAPPPPDSPGVFFGLPPTPVIGSPASRPSPTPRAPASTSKALAGYTGVFSAPMGSRRAFRPEARVSYVGPNVSARPRVNIARRLRVRNLFNT